jgi:hypothetical protein
LSTHASVRRRPIRLTNREREEALDHWRQRGLVDADGNIAAEWRTIVGAAFG